MDWEIASFSKLVQLWTCDLFREYHHASGRYAVYLFGDKKNCRFDHITPLLSTSVALHWSHVRLSSPVKSFPTWSLSAPSASPSASLLPTPPASTKYSHFPVIGGYSQFSDDSWVPLCLHPCTCYSHCQVYCVAWLASSLISRLSSNIFF